MFEVKLKEMKSELTTQIAEETDISEVTEFAKQRVKDANLPDVEVVRVLWDILMDAVQWSGKNQNQNANAVLRQVIITSYLVVCLCINYYDPCYSSSCALHLCESFIKNHAAKCVNTIMFILQMYICSCFFAFLYFCYIMFSICFILCISHVIVYYPPF